MNDIPRQYTDEPRYSVEQQVRWALDTIEHLDETAERTDIHGRPIWSHEATCLTFKLRDDARGWTMTHGNEPVGESYVWRVGDGLKCQIRPADESWAADLEDIADLLPSGWDVDIIDPKALLVIEVDRAAHALASDDGRDKGRTKLADELGVAYNTVQQWLRGENLCSGPPAKLVRQLLD